MNMDNLFFNAKRCLDTAREKVDSGDYETALVSISHVMSHTRALIEQVFKLKTLKNEVESTKGD